MTPGGRAQGAIEVLQDIAARHRPAADSLKDWGLAHRFAGSGDRAAIGTLVYDALRQRRSLAWRMGAETPRALVLGALAFVWGMPGEDMASAFAGDRHAPQALSPDEMTAIAAAGIADAPDEARANVPDWLWPAFAAAFGARAVEQGVALGQRAPLDLRVNTLKATRDKVLKALSRFGAEAAPLTPLGVRIPAPEGGARQPNVQAEAAFQKGWFEVQDAGSQAASLLAGAHAGEQVLDLCAGAGGKTLALAAMMDNKGQIHAYDADRHRLKNIFERLKRAGTRNVQVLPAGDAASLGGLKGRMDLVLVDAPCTGSGVWRRRPDAKWRLTPQVLAARIAEQDAVLDQAAALVRPGGRLVYVTCSMLPAENSERVTAFCARHDDFAPSPFAAAAGGLEGSFGSDLSRETSVQLTPLDHSTDGFFVANLERSA